jgi:hypothetical protein
MRAAARNFTELIVWQKVHAFVLQVYSATQVFLKRRRMGLHRSFVVRRYPSPPISRRDFVHDPKKSDTLGVERRSRPPAQQLPIGD